MVKKGKKPDEYMVTVRFTQDTHGRLERWVEHFTTAEPRKYRSRTDVVEHLLTLAMDALDEPQTEEEEPDPGEGPVRARARHQQVITDAIRAAFPASAVANAMEERRSRLESGFSQLLGDVAQKNASDERASPHDRSKLKAMLQRAQLHDSSGNDGTEE